MRTCKVLLVFSILVLPMHATSIVAWSPGAVSISLLQGTQSVVTVSFSSTQELRNVDPRVSREIRAFVSVSPKHFNVVHKNTRITLLLTFSAGESAFATKYKGKITIRN